MKGLIIVDSKVFQKNAYASTSIGIVILLSGVLGIANWILVSNTIVLCTSIGGIIGGMYIAYSNIALKRKLSSIQNMTIDSEEIGIHYTKLENDPYYIFESKEEL